MEKFMQFSEIGQLTLVEIETKLAKYSELEQEIKNLDNMLDDFKVENKELEERAYKAENKVLELEETIVNLKTKLGWV